MDRGPKPGTTNNPNGRPKGVKNKTTVDIKAIIHKVVDWEARVKNLTVLADAGNVQGIGAASEVYTQCANHIVFS